MNPLFQWGAKTIYDRQPKRIQRIICATYNQLTKAYFENKCRPANVGLSKVDEYIYDQPSPEKVYLSVTFYLRQEDGAPVMTDIFVSEYLRRYLTS